MPLHLQLPRTRNPLPGAKVGSSSRARRASRIDSATPSSVLFVGLRHRSQVEVVGVEVLGRLAADAVGFDDARGDLVLQFEDVIEVAKTPPGSASASRRAATLAPSP